MLKITGGNMDTGNSLGNFLNFFIKHHVTPH